MLQVLRETGKMSPRFRSALSSACDLPQAWRSCILHPVKLAHIADPHLGARQYHRLTSSGINQREADVAQAFRAAVDGVIAERPDVVVVAGDLFHTVRPTNAAIVFGRLVRRAWTCYRWDGRPHRRP